MTLSGWDAGANAGVGGSASSEDAGADGGGAAGTSVDASSPDTSSGAGTDGPGGTAGIGVSGADGGAGGFFGASGGAAAGGVGAGAGLGPGAAGQSAAGVSGSAGPSASTNYSINAAHDGAQPSERIASPLTKRWNRQFSDHVSYPVVANGRVFLSMTDYVPAAGKYSLAVGAYSLENGTPLWGPIAVSDIYRLAYEAGRLFGLGQNNGLLQAWDEATGTVLWSASLHDIDGQYSFDAQFPVAEGGLVYASAVGDNETVYAFDEQTGAPRWHTKVADVSGPPITVSGGAVYAASACDWVFSLDALTGKPSTTDSSSCGGGGGRWPPYFYRGDIWVPDSGVILDTTGRKIGTFPIGSKPAFHNGVAFYNETYGGGVLSAVDLATGATKWTFQAPNPCQEPAVAGAGGQVFVRTSYGQIYEIDEASGHQVSMADTGFGAAPGCEPLAIAQGRLVCADGNGVTVY
jgi:outer membrane protein assembly factor BamB